MDLLKVTEGYDSCRDHFLLASFILQEICCTEYAVE